MSPIEARGLTKRFGKVAAVDGVTFSVEPGKVTIVSSRVPRVKAGRTEPPKSRSLDRRINALRRAGKRRSAAALRRVSDLVECSEGRLGKLGGPQEVAADGVVEGGE